MSRFFDNTATILSYTAYKAGKVRVRQAPVFDGEIIDTEGRPAFTAALEAFFEDGPAKMDTQQQEVSAALIALREALVQEAASPVFEKTPGGTLDGLDIEFIAARRRGETLIMMRVRHAPSAS